jgi:hypothetical protein
MTMLQISGFSSFSSFFNQIASKYVSHYNKLAEQTGYTPAPIETEPEVSAFPVEEDKISLGETPIDESPGTTIADLSDSFEPGEIGTETDTAPVDETADAAEQDTALAPTGSSATYENKFSHLRYKLNLEFNMETFERSLHQLSTVSDGETTEISETLEQLLGANFGLKTDLTLRGQSARETGSASVEGAESYKRGAGRFLARGLQKQALGLKSALPSNNRGSYQLAVNRFALRYKSDTSFSLSHFTRFQSQVTALNGDAALEGYTGAAGELAGSASNELMGAFFDAVQSHLGESEAALIEKVEQFFDIAATELGMSEATLDVAEAQLTDSIGSFFNRVGEAVNSRAADYQTDLGAEVAADPVGQIMPDAEVIPEVIDPDAAYLNALVESLENNEENLAQQLANEEKNSLEPAEVS